MKIIIFSLLLLSSFSIAQVINPEGDDDWKTLEIELKTPHKKTFPNYSNCIGSFRVQFGGEIEYLNSKLVSQGQSLVKRIQIPAASNGRYNVIWTHSGSRIATGGGNVENGTKKIDLSFNRIDVNHMLVTGEDKTTYLAPGRATIFRLNKEDKYIRICKMPTKRGLSVLPGYKYLIKVGADTEDGYDTYEATLDYR